VLPENTKFMGDNAFSGCAGLTEITIPASVKSMGANVFNGCTSLTKIIANKAESEISANDNWNPNWLGDYAGEVQYISTYSIEFAGWSYGSITANKSEAKAGELI
jgi:hypothetical protein